MWENAYDREKKRDVKGRGEVNLALISVLDFYNCGLKKYIVSLKDSENPWIKMVLSKNVLP